MQFFIDAYININIYGYPVHLVKALMGSIPGISPKAAQPVRVRACEKNAWRVAKNVMQINQRYWTYWLYIYILVGSFNPLEKY